MIQNIWIKFAIAFFFIIFTVTACNEEKEGQLAVNAFLAEMSPELARKIDQIKEEIFLTEEKIDKLYELKLKHPNYVGRIETSRRQWKVLQDKLILSLKEIREVVESTYVTYALDKIQGGNQFNKISGKLLSSADSVLASAGVTKNAIEQALNEVENQPLPSLDNISKNSSDIPKPIEHNTYETHEELKTVKEPPTIEMTAEAVKEPLTELKPLNTTNKPLSSPNIPSLCDAKIFLADVHLNLMMMAMSTDKTEQDALKVEIDKASTDFEKVLAAILKDEIDNDQFTALQKTWTVFKNTRETEIIPAIRAGDNEKVSEINGIQAERMNTMNGIIQVLTEDNCD
jgi:hypothetical protein